MGKRTGHDTYCQVLSDLLISMRKECLVEGFDQLSTMATIYNYPILSCNTWKSIGFEKDADWVEYKIYIPDAIPDKHKRISELIQRKYNLKIKKYTSGKKISQRLRTEDFRADE